MIQKNTIIYKIVCENDKYVVYSSRYAGASWTFNSHKEAKKAVERWNKEEKEQKIKQQKQLNEKHKPCAYTIRYELGYNGYTDTISVIASSLGEAYSKASSQKSSLGNFYSPQVINLIPL